MSKAQRKSAVRRKRAVSQGVGGRPTNVRTIAKRGKKNKEIKNVSFLDWALTKVSQGELRQNYYKLLKQYEEENVILVKD
jgi:hypothetical protein